MTTASVNVFVAVDVVVDVDGFVSLRTVQLTLHKQKLFNLLNLMA